MFNVRGILRHFTGRLKSSVNGHCGAQTSKECVEFSEDEYKQLWTPNFWSCEARNRYNDACLQNFSRTAITPRIKSARDDGEDNGGWKSERKSEWNASSITNRSWLEAIGWGAVLGLGLNVLHPRQDQLIRRNCLPGDNCCGFPRWFARFALSMPYTNGHGGIIKSVLSADSYGTQFSEPTEGDESATSSRSEFAKEFVPNYEDGYRSREPVYTSEAAALLSVARNQLAEISNDYMVGLYKLLGFSSNGDASPTVQNSGRGQEEFTLGLFHELGIGVERNVDEALKHYVEAALEDHPIAISNLVSLHRYTSVPNPISSGHLHRSASTPVLSQQSSGFFDDDSGNVSPVAKPDLGRRNSRRFWADDDSGHGDASLSRSSSFPDLSSIVPCK